MGQEVKDASRVKSPPAFAGQFLCPHYSVTSHWRRLRHGRDNAEADIVPSSLELNELSYVEYAPIVLTVHHQLQPASLGSAIAY